MNSSKKLNYDLRPAKFVERKALLSTLLNVCNHYPGGYQYIGFGGLNFSDFKLFHKELHISEMISIEGGSKINKERVQFNSPFSFIRLEYGISTSVLNRINLNKKSIVWLDYDDQLKQFMLNDIDLLFRSLPKGSIYLFTCNRELKDEDTGDIYDKDLFIEKYKDYVPFNLTKKDLSGDKSFTTIRQILLKAIAKSLKSREEDHLKFHQLFNFLYNVLKF